jgi:hypothetical protein
LLTELYSDGIGEITISQPAHGYRRLHRHARHARPCYALGHVAPQSLQATIGLMIRQIRAVQGDNQLVQPGSDQGIDIAQQEPAVGNDDARHGGRRDLSDEADDVGMRQRLTPCRVMYRIPRLSEDRQRPRECVRIDVARGAGQLLVSGKPQKSHAHCRHS